MKILIIEDEHKIANSLKKGFEQERFITDIAYDGTTGYDLAASEEYDAIILDRLLPGMNGMTICKNLRQKQIHTPILLLTAKGQINDRVEGLNAGADDYLTKPFAFEELLARIKAILRRPKKATTEMLQVVDLILNTTTFEVERAGNQIYLSQKEFMFLEYLMRHANKILTKDQIINHVWDYDSSILPNTVEAYMKNLRNKIDKPFSNKKPLLHTHRGFGYMIGKK